MKSNYKTYDHESSFARIDGILATPAGNYVETNTLPDRDDLTYTNGFYVNCTAVFVDIRDSSSLPDLYTRPKLAKLYRAYISEVVAILNSTELAREINIVGDGVWAVFNTPGKSNISTVYEKICQINSLMKTLNYKLSKAGYDKGEIRAGIGAAYGRALVIQAGFSGSGISDVVYMGEVVNRAAKLAAMGNKDYNPPIYLGYTFHLNIKEAYQDLCSEVWGQTYYTSSAVNSAMNNWHKENCK
jgi:class 3 adenylate cyclase